MCPSHDRLSVPAPAKATMQSDRLPAALNVRMMVEGMYAQPHDTDTERVSGDGTVEPTRLLTLKFTAGQARKEAPRAPGETMDRIGRATSIAEEEAERVGGNFSLTGV